MFRDGDQINYTEGSGGNHTIMINRPQKTSEEIKQIKHKITMLKLFLRNVNRKNFTEAQILSKEAELRNLERRLENLSQPQCHKIKKTYKKLPPSKIKEFVLKEIEAAKEKGIHFITAEDIAYQLNVKPHFVKRVLQELNVEGILYQPDHRIPHDSNRDPWCMGGYSGWLADIYRFREEEDDDDNDDTV